MFMVWTCQFGYKFLSGHFSLFLTLIYLSISLGPQANTLSGSLGVHKFHLGALAHITQNTRTCVYVFMYV